MQTPLFRPPSRARRFASSLAGYCSQLSLAFVGLSFAGAPHSYAADATWLLNPVNGDWGTGANWSTGMVPNGPAETAIFGISNVTAISIPPDLSVGTVIFEFQSSAYTITFSAGDFFEFNDGISNVSGLTQNFVAGTDGSGNAGIFQINQAASFSGPNIFTTEAATVPGGNVGIVQFVDESNAGDATIINNGGVMPGPKAARQSSLV